MTVLHVPDSLDSGADEYPVLDVERGDDQVLSFGPGFDDESTALALVDRVGSARFVERDCHALVLVEVLQPRYHLHLFVSLKIKTLSITEIVLY